MQQIIPFLWFKTEAEEAAKFYVSLFKNSKILDISHYGEGAPMPAGTVMTASFELNGQKFIALNGNPEYQFNHSVSFMVECQDQKEVDHFWDKLIADGGKPVACGWLVDKYGLSWQITPTILLELIQDEDKEKAGRVMQAMMQMIKIDIAGLKKAYDGK